MAAKPFALRNVGKLLFVPILARVSRQSRQRNCRANYTRRRDANRDASKASLVAIKQQHSDAVLGSPVFALPLDSAVWHNESNFSLPS